MASEISFEVVLPFTFEHLAEIDMGEDAIALGLRALPEFGVGSLANELPQIRELPGFDISAPGLPGSAAPVIHPFVVRADRDPGWHNIGLQQFNEFQRRNG